MRPSPIAFPLALLLILMMSTLISAIFAFAYWNEYSLEEAIESGRVVAEIRGIDPNGSYQQPMLALTLSKQTILPVTVVIPQGLRLKDNSSQSADVVILEGEKLLLIWRQKEIPLLAYTVTYSQSFPANHSEYEGAAEIDRELIPPLGNDNDGELASQLVFWVIYNEVELKTIEQQLGKDFSRYQREVAELKNKHPFEPNPPPRSEFKWSLALTSFFLLLLFVSLGVWVKEPGNWTKLPPVPPPPQERLVDHLTRWKHINTGGMAEIWTAYDKRRGKKIIVKFPRRDNRSLDQETIKFRFKNEIRYHSIMDHENVVKLIEYGNCCHPQNGHETKYLIQEFIDGKTIYQLISCEGYHDYRDELVKEIVQQVTTAFNYIHQKEVVHRDITWKNIMVDKTGQVYLIDFGNAAIFDSEETKALGLQKVGTPPFHAPLNLIKDVPARDYYSLAVLIYGMYAGKEIMLLDERKLKEEIRRWRKKHTKNPPLVVGKALEWLLTGDYKSADSLEIRRNYFPNSTDILRQLVLESTDPQNSLELAQIDSNANHSSPYDKTELVNI